MKNIITCFLLACACSAGALAQSASETAKAYLGAMESGQYRKAAEFLDRDALRDIRKMLDLGDALPQELAAPFYTQFFGPEATRESVSKLSDSEFFARFLSSLAKQGKEAGVNAYGKVKILGEVPEGEDVVHVLTRQFPVEGPATLEVVSFRKSDGEWKAMLTEKLKGMADQKKKALQRLQKALEMQRNDLRE